MATPDSNDYINGPEADHGISVTRTPITTTIDNQTGHPTDTAGTDETITVVISNRNPKYDFTKSGLLKGADARMYFRTTQTMNKRDKITLSTGEIFRVISVTENRVAFGNGFYKKALIELIDDS